MNVKLVQLVTGEQVIADVVEPGTANAAGGINLHYTLKNPQVLAMQQAPNGMVQIKGLMSMLPYAKMDAVKVNFNHVVFCVDVDDRIRTAYESEHGAIITAPKPGLLLPT